MSDSDSIFFAGYWNLPPPVLDSLCPSTQGCITYRSWMVWLISAEVMLGNMAICASIEAFMALPNTGAFFDSAVEKRFEAAAAKAAAASLPTRVFS